MMLYNRQAEHINYGTTSKDFTFLYYQILKYASLMNGNESTNYGRNKVVAIYYPKLSVIQMGLLAKQITFYSSTELNPTKIGLLALFMKIKRSSFHFSAHIESPKADKFIKLKQMYVKIGKIRVNYRNTIKLIEFDDFLD